MQHLIRKRADDKDFMEIRVAVVGNVDAGTSTLLGTGSCLYFCISRAVDPDPHCSAFNPQPGPRGKN